MGGVEGKEDHIKRFLAGWFEAANPKWNTLFSVTMLRSIGRTTGRLGY